MKLYATFNIPDGDMMPAPVIQAAALYDHTNKMVYWVERPGRHHDVMAAMHAKGLSPKNLEQGFRLESGTFVRRKPAMSIARKNGQLIRNTEKGVGGHGANLYSEDLW